MFKLKQYLKTANLRLKSLTPGELFVLLTVAALLIFAVKFFGLRREYRLIRVEVVGKNWAENFNNYGYRAPFWMSDKIKIGQQELSKTGRVIATLVDLENYERGGEEAEMYLTLRVETVYNKRMKRYTFKDKYLDVGSAIELNLNNIQIEGQVIDNNVPLENYPHKKFRLVVRGRNRDSWIYNSIKPGDYMLNRATGKHVVDIVDVKTEEPSGNVAFINKSSYLTFGNKAQQKDMILTIDVDAYLQDGRWYFAGHQNLKVGGWISFSTNKLLSDGLEVQSVEELTN